MIRFKFHKFSKSPKFKFFAKNNFVEFYKLIQNLKTKFMKMNAFKLKALIFHKFCKFGDFYFSRYKKLLYFSWINAN